MNSNSVKLREKLLKKADELADKVTTSDPDALPGLTGAISTLVDAAACLQHTITTLKG